MFLSLSIPLSYPPNITFSLPLKKKKGGGARKKKKTYKTTNMRSK